MMKFNFSAGPSALPKEVLNRAHEEFLNYAGKGFHIAEISHRSKDYEALNEAAHKNLLKLYGLDESEYFVAFIQGGATAHFSLCAQNFCGENKTINLINTDIWTKKAASEQAAAGFNPRFIASSEDEGFSYIPNAAISSGAAFTYICSNNTVAGTQYAAMPDGLGDLVVDASSDFISRPLDFSSIGALFAGAQKNAGIAGIAPIIIRKDFLERSEAAQLAAMSKYSTHVAARSMYNTPPTWAVYIFGLVLEWLLSRGGLAAIAAANEAKAARLYNYLDSSDFYRPLVHNDRSLMNVCFATPSAEQDAAFVAAANEAGLIGLKGHRAKGGLRASIYNACEMEAIEALIDFCEGFRKAQ